MQPDTRQTPTGYLHSVLRDGANAFLYRSGVRSLLGMPDLHQGKAIFAPAMPPVAFTYSNAECRDEPDAPQFPRNLTADSVLGIQRIGPEGGEEIVPENGQPSTPSKAQAGNTTQFKATKAEPLENSGTMSRNDIQHTLAMPKPSQPMAPSLAPDREMEPVELPIIPEFPGALFNRTTVNIPGASARTQDFPALSPAEKREPP